MYYKVKEFLTEATKAYLSSIDRTDIVVQQGTNNALNQRKTSSKHNANISQDSMIESKTESKKDSNSSQEKINLIIALEHPKDKRHGHFATPLCFTLTKILRTNPKVLAQSLQVLFYAI